MQRFFYKKVFLPVGYRDKEIKFNGMINIKSDDFSIFFSTTIIQVIIMQIPDSTRLYFSEFNLHYHLLGKNKSNITIIVQHHFVMLPHFIWNLFLDIQMLPSVSLYCYFLFFLPAPVSWKFLFQTCIKI